MENHEYYIKGYASAQELKRTTLFVLAAICLIAGFGIGLALGKSYTFKDGYQFCAMEIKRTLENLK